MHEPLLIKGATVVDGVSPEPQPDTDVLVLDGKIAALGREASERALGGAEVVDASGCTLLPGLIDAHSHLSYAPHPGGPLGLNLAMGLEENTIVAVRNARTYLARGFTTVMDVGTRGRIASAVRDAVAAGQLAGPRVLSSGQVISSTGGLMTSYPGWVDVTTGNGAVADGAVELRREVRRQSLTGVDNIKLGVTGQLGTPARDWLLLSREEIAVAVDEAHRRRLTVGAHAYGPEAVKAAVLGGVTILHHAFAGLTDETLEVIAASEAYVAPTMMAFVGKTPPSSWPAASTAYYEANVEGYLDGMRKIAASELRHRVIVGSDSGISNPTATTARELVRLQEVGFSAVDAVKAATSTSARALGIDEERGSLQVGKAADACLVDGDVMQDLRLLQDVSKIRLVLKDGQKVAERGQVVGGLA